MLILTRRPGESLRIEPEFGPSAEADPFGWFAEGPIRVAVNGVRGSQVRIGIQAPAALRILREELSARPKPPVVAMLSARLALARKVAILRILRKWSVANLAAASGLPVRRLSRWTAGRGRWSWANSKRWRERWERRWSTCSCRRGAPRMSGCCWRC